MQGADFPSCMPAAPLHVFLSETRSHLQKVVIVLMRRDGSVQLLLPGGVRLASGRSPRMPCSSGRNGRNGRNSYQKPGIVDC